MDSNYLLFNKFQDLNKHCIAQTVAEPSTATTAITQNRNFSNQYNTCNDAGRTAASFLFSSTPILPPVKKPIMQSKTKTLWPSFLITMALLLVVMNGFGQSTTTYTGKKGITISSHPVSGQITKAIRINKPMQACTLSPLHIRTSIVVAKVLSQLSMTEALLHIQLM